MAITYGFYNSQNGDRKYDAIQVSSIFDGVIGDGVYETIGDAFMVELTEGLGIKIGTGRAWFNHTWTLNDADIGLTLGPADIINARIDTVVLEVNEGLRENRIFLLPGTPSTNPTGATLTNTNDIHQYPLARIVINAGQTNLTSANLINTVGTSECPFVIGVIKTMTIDRFINQWGAQWDDWINGQKKDYQNWLADSKSDFNIWFNGLKVTLDNDAAAKLASQISELNDKIEKLLNGEAISTNIFDSAGDKLLDSSSGEILDSRYIPCSCKKD